MPRPLGPQWVQVYRGLRDASWDTVAQDPKQPLGIHWTRDPRVAQKFATHGSLRPSRYDDGDEGAVIAGLVHRRHLLGKDDPDAVNAGVYPDYHPDSRLEREVTIRPGAPVHVQSVTQVVPDSYPYAFPSDDEDEEDEWEDNVEEFPHPSRKSIRRA